MEIHILVQKCLQMGKHEAATTSLNQKDNPGSVQHTDSPIIKNYRAQKSVKNVTLTAFRDTKGAITIDFLEKGATVNSDFCCQCTIGPTFCAVKKEVCRKRNTQT